VDQLDGAEREVLAENTAQAILNTSTALRKSGRYLVSVGFGNCFRTHAMRLKQLV